MSFFTPQLDQMDCGPACLSMVAKIYGKKYSLDYLRKNTYITREGVSLLGISEAAKNIGFDTFSVKINIKQLIENKEDLPVILHWHQNHFVVLYKISTTTLKNKPIFFIADPALGKIKLTKEEFEKSWLSHNDKGVALFLSPTEKFYKKQPEKTSKLNIRYLLNYAKPYKKQFFYMFFLLFIGSIFTLIFPFLTGALVDKGINEKKLDFIFIILLAQLGVFMGSITVEIIRSWLILRIGTQMSISIISDFLRKMLELPLKFFDTKLMGDFQQRIQDNERIETFLSSHSLTTLFSFITFFVFFGILWYYDFRIFILYTSLSIVSILWTLYWLNKRRILDHFRFQQQSDNQESIYEILNGITAIKLNQLENYKIKKWKQIQEKLYHLHLKILKVDQLQISGFEFINQLKNIVVTYLAATYVVKGYMSLGTLLSISYIIGEMNSPVNQLIIFFRSMQDARLSLERLNEVQNYNPEENPRLKQFPNIIKEKNKADILIKNLSFQYEGPNSPFVLNNIDLYIPSGKITAIVGASGSGKTTLMKLLLRFYDPTNGNIYYNGNSVLTISPKSIRENTGVVMQNGYIFSDTIERNIVTKDEETDIKRLEEAVTIANIKEYIESLPLKYNTMIGAAGNDISGGEKQRILIARAVYKNPQYIFFDEATSSLDAENEKKIHEQLQAFFKGKTVIIIAHRLSTVKNADNIVVLKKGKIVEQGTHRYLVSKKSEYFNLVKNQLELGN